MEFYLFVQHVYALLLNEGYTFYISLINFYIYLYKQFHTQTNISLSAGTDAYNIYCKCCGTNLWLKSQPKLNNTITNVW